MPFFYGGYMLPQATKVINDKEYQLLKCSASESLRLASEVTNMLELNVKEGEEVDVMALVKSLIGNSKFTGLVKDLTGGMTADGKKIEFDTHFRDNPKDLLPVVGFAFKEKVLPFFDPTALETLFAMVTEDLQG